MMRWVRLMLALGAASIFASTTVVGDEIGAELPLFDGGSVDGWSGVPVMYGHELPAGQKVDTVRYYAADNREFEIEDELYNMAPLIVRQENGSLDGEGKFSVIAVGPTHTPSEFGENEFKWGSCVIPDDGSLYHPAAVQWQQDVDDANGGLISFAGGGEGMHFFNVNSTNYVPNEDLGEVEPGLVLSDLQIHSSGFGGRAYQLNFETSAGGEVCETPEPPPPPPPPPEGLIGALPPLANGSVDGWSGIPVMYGHELPAGETVDVVNYYAEEGRFQDELFAIVPLIVKQEDGSLNGDGIFEIHEVGPAHVTEEPGDNSFEWGSGEIPDDGNLYHPAALQWQLDVDDANGGIIAFGAEGKGMHFFNVDTSFFVPNEDIGEVEPGLVLSDLQTHTSPGNAGRSYQLNFQMSNFGATGTPGDFNNDDAVDALDVNLLSEEIRTDPPHDPKFDVNEDGNVDLGDHNDWVKGIKNTWFGDANLDGEFNSSDFVDVFQGGLFETGQAAGWELGDWDADGKFDSSDFVKAFQDGGFEKGPKAHPGNVPEPAGLGMLVLGLFLAVTRLRRRK